jgi:tetratricopeptide (TPR) repeat protein
MEEPKEQPPGEDLAARIEKTLADREQARRAQSLEETLPSSMEDTSRKTRNFSLLMLLVGVVVGAIIGAVLYFVMPGTGMLRELDNLQLEASAGLVDADRLLVSGEYDAARKAYMNVIAQDSKSPRPYNNLASLYAAEGNLDQAQILLNLALETDADYLTVYRNVGKVYAAMARDSYNKALQLEGAVQPLQLQLLGIQNPPLIAQESAAGTTRPLDAPGKAEPVTQAEAVTQAEPVTQAEAVTQAEPVTQVEAVTQAEAVTRAEPMDQPDSALAAQVATLSPQQFLLDWAKAWSDQNVEAYLAGYADDYVPDGNLAHDLWQEQRRQRLKAPTYIKVVLEPFESLGLQGETVKIQVVQAYESDRFRDRTRKLFVLRPQGQSWAIVEERSLGRVR